MDDAELLIMARKAQQNAHAPYSGFKVGAAVLGETGAVYLGCNVESSSFGLSICAERNAIFQAVSKGEKSIKAVALACSRKDGCVPCGACLHIISEFGPGSRLVREGSDGIVRVSSVKQLLPEVFHL